jgi:DNA (cytosine-5)-methyltransferase 1
MKILDLFSGIGGFSLGLERAGFETVAFCEIDKYCQEVLKKIWNKKIYNDVKEITKQKLKSDGIEFPEVITGGFPCQPFSVAGSRKGSNDSRYLWPEMFRIIKEFKPRWIIGENVRNIINIQDGMVFENVCTDLEGEGYEVRAFNIPAAAVNAPHKRERIWILANSRRSIRREQSTRNKESIRSRAHEKTEWSCNTSEIGRPSEGAETVANPSAGRRPLQEEQISTRRDSTQHQSWWKTEPNVGRVADGLPGRIYRLRALGNSIVPQIAEEIGKAIMLAEKEIHGSRKI